MNDFVAIQSGSSVTVDVVHPSGGRSTVKVIADEKGLLLVVVNANSRHPYYIEATAAQDAN